MIQYLEKLIFDNWEKWGAGEKPDGLDFLKTHAGQATRNKKVGFFVFNKNKPFIFIKTVREDKYNHIIEDGFKRLKKAHQALNNDSIPVPIYSNEHKGVAFSLETAIVGEQFHSFKEQKDLNRFLGWFLRFQQLMVKKENLDTRQLRDYLYKLINDFLNLYKPEKDLEELIKDVGEDVQKDIDFSKLPLITQHGDLTPDNVLDDKGNIKVIDWDNFDKIDLPLFDLLVFLQRWSSIRDVSFVFEYYSKIEEYLKEFKIDKKAVKPLIYVYYLLDFMRKKDSLTDYDKEYLTLRLREIKNLSFK